MVFDDKIDSSLYMLIENDEKNRFTIVEFIQSLPGDLLKKIRSDEESNDIFVNEDGKAFSFKHSDDSLSITNHNIDIPYNRLHEITLYSLEENKKLNSSNKHCQMIAEVTYNRDDTGLEKINYYLVPNRFIGYKFIGMNGNKKYLSSEVNLKGLFEEQKKINETYNKKRTLKK